MRRLLITLFFCLTPLLASLPPVDLSFSHQNAVTHALLLEDPDQSLSFADVWALPDDRLAPVGKNLAQLHFSHSALWLRLTVHNSSGTSLKKLLAFTPPWLDRIEIQIRPPSGVLASFEGGDAFPFTQRSFSHPDTVFPLTFEPGTSQLLVRVTTRDPFVVSAGFWDEQAFWQDDQKRTLFDGVLYGILGAMGVYNLLLFLTIRSRPHAFYALYIFVFVVMSGTYNGYLALWLFPDNPEAANWLHSIFIFIYPLAGLLFAAHFLELKKRFLPAYRAFLLYLFLSLALFVLTAVLGGYAAHVATAIYMVFPFSLLMLTVGILSWMRGNRFARFFVLGTSAGAIGTFITALSASGFIPFGFLTHRAVDLGMVLDALLLSMALADRYKALEKEQIRQENALEEQERFARELKHQIDVALEKNREQEQVILRQHRQAMLGSMISIIAHQMRQPLSAISMSEQLLEDSYKNGELSPEVFREFSGDVHDNIRFMSRTIDDFRNYFNPDKEPKNTPLSPLVQQIVKLLDKKAQNRKVCLESSVEADLMVFTHPGELQQVLLNLLSNAIEVFDNPAPEASRVTLTATGKKNRVEITIEDNGGGIPEEAFPRLFQLFFTTKGEQGTGIGLYMCKMIITESLKGEIRAENTGDGARFTMLLPSHQ